MRISSAIKSPTLYYYGGKWLLAPWIISHFPPHDNYLEPCMGACSVLLRKPRSRLETINDIDGDIVNFFQVLRERPKALLRYIQLTPWSRTEFERVKQPADDPLESARRLYARLAMGRASSVNTGWKFGYNYQGSAAFRLARVKDLLLVARRLQYVQIEHRDALEIIPDFDRPNTLIYFDPPYVQETRASTEQYTHEVSEGFHVEAARLLRQCAGYVVVSGYNCPLYEELYRGWHREDIPARTTSHSVRIESLWLSPRTVQALGKPRQGRLI